MADEEGAMMKTQMTDEERLALCQKLDKELDDFIDGLEHKRYTEGWSEDTWEEEMDKHPFFMKSTPEGEMSALAEGLAKLKYDPEENTPLELATNYKEDGNFNFKHKNYRLAILGYTEGIKVKCDNSEMNASLYNNRAAAHWHLKNYRSALLDSEKCLTFNPDHIKARIRAAKSAFEAAKYETCIEHCQKLLEKQQDNKDIVDLMNTAKKKKMVQERDQRKKERSNLKNAEQKEGVIKAIKDRKIKISKCDDEDDIELSKLEPSLPSAQDAIVHIKDGILHWPVLFLYPEYQLTDFIRDCPENIPLLCQLQQVFPAPWDEDNKYSVDKVNVYFEGYDKVPHIINPSKTLSELLVMKYFELRAGTPAFFILPRGSDIERRYLNVPLKNLKMK